MTCDPHYDELHFTIGSKRNVSLNLAPALDTGELVASVTSVEDVTNNGAATGDLTISNTQVNSVAYTEEVTGDTVAIGQAAQFTISSSTTIDAEYLLKITVATDSSPAQTIVDYLNVSFCK